MDAIEALVRSLPAEADRIRRRFWRDPEFRTVCEDYRDLLLALAALETGPSELLAEAAEALKGDRS